jgi:Ca-activated chloride channel homolog
MEEQAAFASRRKILGLLISTPIGFLIANAQKLQGVEDEPQFVISSTVQRVLLDVSVKDNRGGYVTGLTKDNFKILENGRPQPIINFTSVDTPVTVGLIVDNSGSMREKRPAVVIAGLAFAKESNPQDQFFVVNFNNAIVPGLPPGMNFSDDLQTLRAALYMGSPAGQTALYDAIVYGLEHLQKAVQPKKTLIVVSDGGDNVSKASLTDVLRLIQASQATVYTVGLFTEDDPDRNPGILQKMARLSGGEYFQPPLLSDVIPIFHKIAKDIRNRYTISYAPDPTLDPAKYPDRSIRVTANAQGHRKLSVHTRTSYTFRGFSGLLAETLKKEGQFPAQ